MVRQYKLGNKTFETKKEIHSYMSNIMKVCQCISRGGLNFAFISDLIKYHPEYLKKVGAGVKYFQIKPNVVKYNELIIHTTDNKENRISWNVCCKLSPTKKVPPLEELTDAMRESIHNDCLKFKNTTTQQKCQNCQTTTDLQVDHKDTPFCQIRNAYLEQNELDVPTKFEKCDYGGNCFLEKDKLFEKKWIEFHRTYATYQLLCGNCNRHKGINMRRRL